MRPERHYKVIAADSHGRAVGERVELGVNLWDACCRAHEHLRNRQPTYYFDAHDGGNVYRANVVDGHCREYNRLTA